MRKSGSPKSTRKDDAQRKKVLVVAAQTLFREGLIAILTRDDGLAVVAQARTGDEALAEAVRVKPDLALIDLSVPDCSGMDPIRRMRRRLPRIKVIAVGPDARPERISAAVEAGIAGYLQRDSQSARLLQCLGIVTAGGFCVDDKTMHGLADGMKERSHVGRGAKGPAQGLTPRQTEILRATAEGKPPKRIASELGVSVKTVENHRAHVMSKLGLSTTVDLVRFAAHTGLIDLDEWKDGH